MRRAPEGWPTWKRPVPCGIAQAIGAAGTVLAPLLAGFSVTLIVLTLEVVRVLGAPVPGEPSRDRGMVGRARQHR